MEPQILRRFLVLWASRIVLKTAITSNESLKNKFREAERTSIKLIETESHRSFNECCLINNLLPIYTNIYIYIYIYIYIIITNFSDKVATIHFTAAVAWLLLSFEICSGSTVRAFSNDIVSARYISKYRYPPLINVADAY